MSTDAKRCPDCGGFGYIEYNDVSGDCGTCDGTGGVFPAAHTPPGSCQPAGHPALTMAAEALRREGYRVVVPEERTPPGTGEAVCEKCGWLRLRVHDPKRCECGALAPTAAVPEAVAVRWENAGGPNECEHGYAAGVPCPDCVAAAGVPAWPGTGAGQLLCSVCGDVGHVGACRDRPAAAVPDAGVSWCGHGEPCGPGATMCHRCFAKTGAAYCGVCYWIPAAPMDDDDSGLGESARHACPQAAPISDRAPAAEGHEAGTISPAAAGEAVHWSDWAGQPQIRVACDQSYGTPEWSERGGMTDTPNVYRRDDQKLYAFERDPVTCDACRSLMPAEKPLTDADRMRTIIYEKIRAAARAEGRREERAAVVHCLRNRARGYYRTGERQLGRECEQLATAFERGMHLPDEHCPDRVSPDAAAAIADIEAAARERLSASATLPDAPPVPPPRPTNSDEVLTTWQEQVDHALYVLRSSLETGHPLGAQMAHQRLRALSYSIRQVREPHVCLDVLQRPDDCVVLCGLPTDHDGDHVFGPYRWPRG